MTSCFGLSILVITIADGTSVSCITTLSTSGLSYNRIIVVLVCNNFINPSVLTLASSIVHTKNSVNGKLVALYRLVRHRIIAFTVGSPLIKTINADLVAICILKIHITVCGVINISYNTSDVVLIFSIGRTCLLSKCKCLRNGKSRTSLGHDELFTLITYKVIKTGVTSSGNYNVHSVGNLSKCLVRPCGTTVLAVPVLDVTVYGTGSSLCCNVNKGVSCFRIGQLTAVHAMSVTSVEVVVTGSGNNNASTVSNLSKRLVRPCGTADLTVPVLNVTVLGTGSSLSSNVYDLVSLILSYLIANLANSVTSVEVAVTECRNNNSLEVGKLSKSRIGEYCLATCAVPVLVITVLGTGSSLSLNVNDLSGVRSYNALEVRKLSKSYVGEYCITICAVPVLYVTVLVARSLNSSNVLDLSGVRNYNALEVRKLSKSYIGEYCKAVGAVPVLNVTVLMARNLNSINVSNLSGVNESEVLSVGELNTCCISKYSVTNFTEPVLLATILVAGSGNLSNVGEVVKCGDDYVLSIGLISESLISPNGITVLAVPVLNVTGLVAGRINSLCVKDGVVCGRIGLLEAVHTNLVTSVEVLVSSIGSGLKLTYCTSSVTLIIVAVVTKSGDHNVSVTNSLGKSLVYPNGVTVSADPVLKATSLKTGLVLSLNVLYVVAVGLEYGLEAPLTLGIARRKRLVLNLRDVNHHLVKRHTGTLSVIPAACTVCTSVVLDVTESDTSRSLSLYEYDVVSCILVSELIAVHTISIALKAILVSSKRKSYVVLGKGLSKRLVIPYVTAVLTSVVNYVTVYGTGGILCRNENSLVSCLSVYNLEANLALLVTLVCNAVTECRNNNSLEVGKLSKSRIGEYCLAICAVPVLVITVLGTGSSLCCNVLDLGSVKNGEVLSVGEVTACCISKYSVTLRAEPVLRNTVLVASCLNCRNVGKLVKSGNDYVLSVGKLSKSSVGEYSVALGAEPVLVVTGLVASGSYCLNVLNVSGVNKGEILSVGEVTACCVSKYSVTLSAVPVLGRTVLVALCLNCGNVGKLVKSGDDYVLSVGKLSKSSVGEYSVTLGAEPVLNVTGLVASGSYCLNVLDSCGAADDNVLVVGKLSKSLILPYLLTGLTVPVLNVTVLVTVSLGSLNVNNLAAKCGKDYVLDVGKLSESLILPYLLTGVADPVLDATGVMATGSNSVHMYEKSVAGSGKDYVLAVGKLGASCILPYSVAIVTYPVLDVTDVVASGSNSLKVSEVALKLGENYALEVGNLGESCICPCVTAIGAVPVLNVTGLSAGSILRIYVSDGMLSLFIGKLAAVYADLITSVGILVFKLCNYSACLVDLLSISRIRPYGTASCAVPVLDVTVVSTGSILCLNVLNVVRTVELKTAGELVRAGKLRKVGARSKADCYHCDYAKKQQVFPFHCERPP